MVQTQPLLIKKNEKFENKSETDARSFFFVFGIIALIVFAAVGGIYLVKHGKTTLGLTSSTSPANSKFLLTATPNYF